MSLGHERAEDLASGEQARSPRRRGTWMAVLLIVLAVLMSGVVALLAHGMPGTPGAGEGPTAARATATATATPVLRMVYAADWSKGAAGWTLPPAWHTSEGALDVDGAASSSATVPYVATGRRYQIEMEIAVQAVGGQNGARQGHYELIATNDHGDMLWNVKAMCFARPEAGCVGALYSWAASTGTHNPGAGGGISASDFVSGSGAQTYVVTVDERTLDYCVSGDCLGDSVSDGALAPAHLAFSAQNVRLVLSRFVVRAL